MADLIAYRAALLQALASGALSVSGGGVSTTFRSVSELKTAIATIDAEIAKTSRNGRVSSIRVSSDKGW